jgi:hypothetical protein
MNFLLDFRTPHHLGATRLSWKGSQFQRNPSSNGRVDHGRGAVYVCDADHRMMAEGPRRRTVFDSPTLDHRRPTRCRSAEGVRTLRARVCHARGAGCIAPLSVGARSCRGRRSPLLGAIEIACGVLVYQLRLVPFRAPRRVREDEREPFEASREVRQDGREAREARREVRQDRREARDAARCGDAWRARGREGSRRACEDGGNKRKHPARGVAPPAGCCEVGLTSRGG